MKLLKILFPPQLPTELHFPGLLAEKGNYSRNQFKPRWHKFASVYCLRRRSEHNKNHGNIKLIIPSNKYFFTKSQTLQALGKRNQLSLKQ